MTLKDVCERFEIKPNNIKFNFYKVAKQIYKKYNLRLIQLGEDHYQIQAQLAPHFYEQKVQKIHLQQSMLRLDYYDFMAVVGIMCLPQGQYWGTFDEFIKYIGLKINSKNIDGIIKSIIKLNNGKYIKVRTKEYGLRPQVLVFDKYVAAAQGDYLLPIDVIKKCYQIMAGMRISEYKISHLLKVYAAMHNQNYDEKFGYKRLEELTGLSAYQIRQAYKLLDENGLMNGIVRYQSYFKYVFDDYKESKLTKSHK